MTEGVIEQPAQDQQQEQAESPALSIKEHAAQYGPGAEKTAAAEPETAEQKAEREHHSAQQRREKDTGKFDTGKVRHRAKSQQAAPEDAPRIRELTWRAAEAERKLGDAQLELASLRRQGASPQRIEQAEAKVERAEAAAPVARASDPKDPEPQETDAKYAGDYGKFLMDRQDWAARQAIKTWEASQNQAREQAKKQEAATTALKTFGQRIDAAKNGGKYPDFQQVALSRPAPWDAGSAIDAFIMEDDNGAEVLYYLQHPSQAQEVGELLTLSPLQQLKRLSLLSQRFSPSPSAAAASTGSAPGRQTIVLPHKPPNPVRTEAHSPQGPPKTDGSLTVMGHAKAFHRS